MTVKSIIQQPKKKIMTFKVKFFFFFFLRKIKVKFNSQRHAFETLLLDIFTKELRDTRNACDTVFFKKKKKNYLRGMMKKWKDDKEIFVFSFICLIEGMEK